MSQALLVLSQQMSRLESQQQDIQRQLAEVKQAMAEVVEAVENFEAPKSDTDDMLKQILPVLMARLSQAPQTAAPATPGVGVGNSG